MVVPPEILDLIIDALAEPCTTSRESDIATLRACSLTSHSLRKIVQRHLFRTLRIVWNVSTNVRDYIPKVQQLALLLQANPSLYNYTRNLEVELDLGALVTDPSTGLSTIMHLLCADTSQNQYAGLESIRLSGHNKSLVSLSVIHPQFGAAIDRLINPKHPTARPLRRVVFSYLTDMPPSLTQALSPDVQDLTLGHLYFQPNASQQSSRTLGQKALPCLRSLTLDGSISGSLCHLSQSLVPNLVSLRVQLYSYADYNSFLRFIHSSLLARNLTTLEVSSPWSAIPHNHTLPALRPLDLSTLSLLRDISFHFFPEHPTPLRAARPFLAHTDATTPQISLPLFPNLAPLRAPLHIDTIHIHIFFNTAAIFSLDASAMFLAEFIPHFARLDTWMSSPQLPLLRRVFLALNINCLGMTSGYHTPLQVLDMDAFLGMRAEKMLPATRRKVMDFELSLRVCQGADN